MRKATTTRLVVAWIRRVWVASGALVLLLMPVYVWWTYTPRLPVDALSSDATVSVERSDVLRIPTRALIEGERAFVLEDGVVRSRAVSKGIGNWEYTEVTAGLEAGARVVVSIDREGLADGVPAVAR